MVTLRSGSCLADVQKQSAHRRCVGIARAHRSWEAAYALGVKNPITVTKFPDGVV